MKGHRIAYGADELAFVEAGRLLVIGELHRQFLDRFGRQDVSASNLHSLRKRKGWSTGRPGCFAKGLIPHNKGKPHPSTGRAVETQFKKGNLPHNTHYAGHERVSKDGYVEISIEETNPHTGFGRRYVLKHRWLWEKANGPIPEGMALKCRGDRLDTDPSNWHLIPRALLPRLSGRFGRGYDAAPADLKPVIMAVSELEHAARKRRAAA